MKIHPTTPNTNIISKIAGSSSGLWGVTSMNEVSLSGKNKQIQIVILLEPQNLPAELLSSIPNLQEKTNNILDNILHSCSTQDDKCQSLSWQTCPVSVSHHSKDTLTAWNNYVLTSNANHMAQSASALVYLIMNLTTLPSNKMGSTPSMEPSIQAMA